MYSGIPGPSELDWFSGNEVLRDEDVGHVLDSHVALIHDGGESMLDSNEVITSPGNYGVVIEDNSNQEERGFNHDASCSIV